MRTVLRTVFQGVTALLLAVAAGCAVAPASPGPSGPVARIVEGCRLPEYRERQECYERAILAHQRAAGVEAAMRMLDTLAAREPEVKREGHVYAHAIGLAAYTSPAEVGRTFARCDPAYQSGCYHGVIQAYFVDAQRSGGAVDAEAMNALCAEHRGREGNTWLLFQCTHGAGHGLAMFHGHHLPTALQGCDLLTEGWERESCYGGAFMESIVNATHPHHPPASGVQARGHEGHGAHAGHGAAEHHPPFRALDPKDLHHPCSVVDRRYRRACYSIQTAAMLFHTGGNVERVAGACAVAPAEVRRHCFLSLGRDISGITLRDHAASVRLCAQAAPEYRPWCHAGVVRDLVNFTASPDDGLSYCRSVPDPQGKARCYEAVGEQSAILHRDTAPREALCARAEAGYAEACRFGARLESEKPPVLSAPGASSSP